MGWIHNVPNDTPTDGPMVTAVASILTGISFCFVCLRGYVRARLIHALGKDDWIVFVTWFITCGFTVVLSIQTTWGLGMKSIGGIPRENMQPFGMLEYAASPLYILSILGFKLSLLVSYFRFVPQGMCKYGVSCVLISCTLFHLSCLIVQLNLCHPIASQWNPDIPGRCINTTAFYKASSALTIIFDFAVMFLPFPVLIKTKIQTRKKVVLLGLFALGFFITVIQIVRLRFMKGLNNPLNSGPVILWSAVEANLGVIVACIPVLSPLFKSNRNRTGKGTYGSTRGSTTAPSTARRSCRVVKQLTSSEDELFSEEKTDTDRLVNSRTPEPALGSRQIIKETDIVVINQLAPAHPIPSRDAELGGTQVADYECWAQSANMTVHNGPSSHSLDRMERYPS